MEKDEIGDEVRRLKNMFDSRQGYASFFARENDNDRARMELSTAQEWCNSVNAKYNLSINNVSSNSQHNEPPDCFACRDGVKISIELTELVNGDMLEAIQSALKSVDGANCKNVQWSEDKRAQWNEEKFKIVLSERIQKKEKKYKKRLLFFDVLIVHADEPWLSVEQVETWLSRYDYKSTGVFQSGYFLMSYSPQLGRWPVYQLF